MRARQNAQEACQMSVFRPTRRRHFVARWRDPETEQRQERTLGTHIKRDAHQRAAELADKIVSGMALDDPTWLAFSKIYERLHLARRSESYRANWGWVKWGVERDLHSPQLSRLTAARIADWQRRLLESGKSVNTVASYSRRLRAGLRWAAHHDLLARVPYIRVETEEVPAGRDLTTEEIERMLAAVGKIRPHDAECWRRLILGQVYSGLRIDELRRLLWEPDAPVRVERGKRHWLIVIGKQKNRKRQEVPAFPEFWKLVLADENRSGHVFAVPNGRGGQMTTKRLIRWISAMGERAGIVANVETGKHATSHDLRRTFTVRLLERLSLADATKVTRHADPRTLLAYYYTVDAEALADKMKG